MLQHFISVIFGLGKAYDTTWHFKSSAATSHTSLSV